MDGRKTMAENFASLLVGIEYQALWSDIYTSFSVKDQIIEMQYLEMSKERKSIS